MIEIVESNITHSQTIHQFYQGLQWHDYTYWWCFVGIQVSFLTFTLLVKIPCCWLSPKLCWWSSIFSRLSPNFRGSSGICCWSSPNFLPFCCFKRHVTGLKKWLHMAPNPSRAAHRSAAPAPPQRQAVTWPHSQLGHGESPVEAMWVCLELGYAMLYL